MNAAPSSADRKSAARRQQRLIRQAGWIQGVIDESKAVAQTLLGCCDEELRRHTDQLCRFGGRFGGRFRGNQFDGDQRMMLVLAAAGIIEAFRRTLGVQLFDVQLHAGILVSHGMVAEMQTGEGKTFAVALPTYVRALDRRGVHLAPPNHYLAERDHAKLTPVFSALGMTTGLLREKASLQEIRAAYQADITYGAAHAFGFDYLRDQWTLDRLDSRDASRQDWGNQLYAQWSGEDPPTDLLQRGLHAVIIDEVDHVLIDDAVSPLLLSGAQDGESPDAEVHHHAAVVAAQLCLDDDYVMSNTGKLEMTESGFNVIYQDTSMTVHPQLVRSWGEYVIAALRSRCLLQRDVHYVVQEDSVEIVDDSTGRIYQDRSWSKGLHQAIEAKEGLPIRCENVPLAKITRQRFYRYYRHLGGMTGTASGCESEFAAVYGMATAKVPPRIPSKRTLLPEHITATHQEKFEAIAIETRQLCQSGRAVLIGTLNIGQSLQVAEVFTAHGLPFQLLNGIQDAAEAAIIRQAGQPGAITVATPLAGRGTDIKITDSVADAGGLHVIVTENHSLARVDRQLIGRCARCGDPGSARVFLSPEDQIIQDHAPWIHRAILRWDQKSRRGSLKLADRLLRVQAEQQRVAASQRWRSLQEDQQEGKLLNRNTPQPKECWSYAA